MSFNILDPQWTGLSGLHIYCATPLEMVIFTLIPETPQISASGGMLIGTPVGQKYPMVVCYTPESTNLSPPLLIPSYFPKSVFGKLGPSSASTFHQRLQVREGHTCAVSGNRGAVVASHLIPRRIGTEGVQTVVERLDSITMHGTTAIPGVQPLHGYSVTLQVRAGTYPLPPSGVFNWHYLQCVISMFGTQEYKTISDIWFYIFPFQTALDSSGSESGGNFPPSHPIGHLAHQMESDLAIEHDKQVLEWASGVPSASGVSDHT
ncbi:hypothetical protein EDB85DRAFT_1889622 [Lactarius pseudohatsudake]|nr:hypothetical protein EDB85DRAFT_1889622 [Lactarius pseudohatsudake]